MQEKKNRTNNKNTRLTYGEHCQKTVLFLFGQKGENTQ